MGEERWKEGRRPRETRGNPTRGARGGGSEREGMKEGDLNQEGKEELGGFRKKEDKGARGG